MSYNKPPYFYLLFFLLLCNLPVFLFVAADYKMSFSLAVFLLILIFLFDYLVIMYANAFFVVKPQIAQELQEIFKGYSNVDISEMINMTAGFKEINDILQGSDTTVDIPISKLSVLWRDEELLKDTDQKFLSEDDIWKLYLGESLLKQENIFDNQLINDYFLTFKSLLSEIKQHLGDNIYQELRYDIGTVLILLRVLDQQGSCSSVVNTQVGTVDSSEPDLSKKNDFRNVAENPDDALNLSVKSVTMYDILSQVRLDEHTIHVVNNIQKVIMDNKWGYALLVPSIIAALAHDIGKIPSFYQDASYTTHMHPSIGVEFLKRIDLFLKIPEERRNLILKAILSHHSSITQSSNKDVSENLILTALKKADQISRDEEFHSLTNSASGYVADPPYKDITSPVKEVNQDENEPNQNQTDDNQSDKNKFNKKRSKLQKIVSDVVNQLSTTKKQTPTLPAKTSLELEDIGNIENIECIDATFIDSCLFEIGKIINVVEKVKDSAGNIKEIYNSFSFDNAVFVRADKMIQIYEEMFKKYNCLDIYNRMVQEQIATNYGQNGQRTFRQALMRYMGDLFSKNNLLAKNYVKPGFFGGYFVVKGKDDSIIFEKAFYIPFDFKAFEQNYDYITIENRKNIPEAHRIKKIQKIEFAPKSS
ncbi:MAG: HD domain-containing protein [Candidatus Micrarchaeaceae archaeon]